MGKIIWALSMLILHQVGVSQKLVEKEIFNPETKVIEINAANCYLVTLATHHGKQLRIQAAMEGEYAQDLSIGLEERGSNILISAGFLPSFNALNDKLSVHKVISISLSITLPEDVQVKVYGTHSNVFAKGKYKGLSVTLADGNCTLGKTMEKVHVKTHKGRIIAQYVKGTVLARTDYGTVFRGNVSNGRSHFDLYSVEGDILVNMN